jgi:hypothetical protein
MKIQSDWFSAGKAPAGANSRVGAHAKRAPGAEAGAKAGVLSRERTNPTSTRRKNGPGASSCQEAACGAPRNDGGLSMRDWNRSARRRLLCAASAIWALSAGAALAQAMPFTIDAQPAAAGIRQFARQAGVQILVQSDAAAGQAHRRRCVALCRSIALWSNCWPARG